MEQKPVGTQRRSPKSTQCTTRFMEQMTKIMAVDLVDEAIFIV